MKRYPLLSTEDESVFLKTLGNLWDVVAVDCLTGIAEERRIKSAKSVYGVPLSPADQVTARRSVVIEIALDQFAQGHSEVITMPREQYQRIREWLRQTPEHIIQKVAKKQFTYSRYGT